MSDVLEVILRVQDGASAPLRAAGAAAAQAAPQVAGLQAGMGGLSRASGDTGKQLLALKMTLSERLAPALMMISPELGTATAGLGRFASMASLVGGAGGGILLPVAAAVMALGAAYKYLAGEAKKAEDAQKKAADQAQRMQETALTRSRKVGLAGLRAQVAEGELPQSALDAYLARMQSEADYADDIAFANERLAKARRDLTQATQELTAAEGGGVTGAAYAEVQARVNHLTETVAAEEVAFRALSERIDDHAANLYSASQKTTEATKETKGFAAAAREATVAVEEFVGPIKDWDDAVVELELDSARAADGIAELVGQWERLRDKGLSLGQAAVGGNVAAIGSLLGGGLVGGGMDILGSLGEQGAAGVGEGLKISSKSIIEGLKELPKLIGEVLPDLVGGIMEGLIAAIPVLLEQLPTALLELGYYLVMELPRAIAEAIKEQGEKGVRRGAGAISDLFGDSGLFSSVADAISKGGSYAEGTPFVSRTQLAIVHQGEEIVGEGGRSTRGGRMGGGVTNYITGYVGPEALAELDRQMRAYAGLGLTWGT